MDSIKTWLVNVAIKQLLPSFVRAAIAWIVAMLIAHSGVLSAIGVFYDQTTHIISIHLDKVQGWMLGAGIGLITAGFAALQHHAGAVITGKPQDGSHVRKTDSTPTEGQQ